MRSSFTGIAVAVSQGVLTLGFALGLQGKAFPLGVPGEWEWLRLPIPPEPLDLLLATVGLAIYAVFAALGFRMLRRKATVLREITALVSLSIAAITIQLAVQTGAPTGYGLAKWIIAIHSEGSSGYFTVASKQVESARTFASDYPEWIKRQDPLHIGTHPPGLILIEYALLETLKANSSLVQIVDQATPASAALAAKFFITSPPLKAYERSTLVVTGFLVLASCALTVLPLYGLARVGFRAETSWAIATVWPLIPSAILFQPTADTAFPFLSTFAVLLASASASTSKRRGMVFAVLSGLLLGLGMQLSLVFLPVGLIIALLLMSRSEASLFKRCLPILMIGVGFFCLTLAVWLITQADPFQIWWTNQSNHARFYTTYPRSYRAWIIENPLELLVGLGLPTSFLALISLRRLNKVPRAAFVTAGVLIALTLSGKNLSEVGRLWIPFMPILLLAIGTSLEKFDIGPKGVGCTLFFTGLQTLAMESLIQVVYPV